MSGASVGFMQLFIERNSHDIFHFIMSFIESFWIIFVIWVIASIFISSYYVRVMKTTVEGLNKAPDWDKIDDLFIKGLCYIIGLILLAFIFLIIPIALYLFSSILASINETAGLIFILLTTLFFILSIIILWFYSKLAEVNYSVRGFLGFFEFGKIFEMISLKYIILLIVIAIIELVISLIVVVPLDTIGTFLLVLAYTNKNITALYIAIKNIVLCVINICNFYLAVFSIRAVALYYKDRKGIE
ncbi:DUF4013 domain-containing protein [Methanocaldococcus fervens]